MLYRDTYQQALAEPTSKGGMGWSKAFPHNIQAALAQALGAQFCLNPQAIWDWANRHDVHLMKERKRVMQPDVLLVAVLNDWDLNRTEQEMKG